MTEPTQPSWTIDALIAADEQAWLETAKAEGLVRLIEAQALLGARHHFMEQRTAAKRNARVARELLTPIAERYGIPHSHPDAWLHLAVLLAIEFTMTYRDDHRDSISHPPLEHDTRTVNGAMLAVAAFAIVVGGLAWCALSNHRSGAASVNAPAFERSVPSSTTGYGGSRPWIH